MVGFGGNEQVMKAELLSVGSELTSGLTVDTNSAWLAGRLARLGIEVGRQVTVGDDLDAIKEALREAAGRSEVVVVTGGLGPTEDDRTRQAVAAALGVGVRTDEAVLEGIRAMFRRRRARWSESNARQALIPEGAQPIENPWGTAAGIRAEVGDSLVYCLPGVPAEMERMFEASVGPELADFGATGVLLTHTLRCFGAGESRIGEQIADLMGGTGPVRVGTTAHEAVIGIRFFVRGRTRDQAQGLLDEAVVEVRQRLGPLVFGEGQATLESAVGGILGSRGLTLATAESCTGGLLAKRLTDVPGSSAYFLRGLV
ncbi:MAG: CinA family nicotinamide mononucleotide deamidase-related protein, partial [Phycisphaerae bacterium]